MTLAWVLWHTRRPEVSRESYVEAVGAFYRAMEREPPQGYISRLTIEYASVPWIESKTEVFEEWHLVGDSETLDRVDGMVYRPAIQAPHAAMAPLAGGAIAGLYRLRFGEPSVSAGMRVLWMEKPAGISYEVFVDGVRTEGARESVLWSRHMVLGPTPEFCLMTSGPFAVGGIVPDRISVSYAGISPRGVIPPRRYP